MKILVFGAGVVGTVYAWQLSLTGHDEVALLVRPGRKQEGVSRCSLSSALNLLLGYLLISPPGNQSRVPFGEMLGFAVAFMGAFVAHMVIWRSYPGGSWWAPPDVWPPARKVPEKAQSLEN